MMNPRMAKAMRMKQKLAAAQKGNMAPVPTGNGGGIAVPTGGVPRPRMPGELEQTPLTPQQLKEYHDSNIRPAFKPPTPQAAPMGNPPMGSGSMTPSSVFMSRANSGAPQATPQVTPQSMMAKGGKVRGDGICQRGKTKGRFV